MDRRRFSQRRPGSRRFGGEKPLRCCLFSRLPSIATIGLCPCSGSYSARIAVRSGRKESQGFRRKDPEAFRGCVDHA